MDYRKPKGTLRHNHVYLDPRQRIRLISLGLIDKKTILIHINDLARRYKVGYIKQITPHQIKVITKLFESIGYKFKDGEVRRTQVGTALIFDHNK